MGHEDADRVADGTHGADPERARSEPESRSFGKIVWNTNGLEFVRNAGLAIVGVVLGSRLVVNGPTLPRHLMGVAMIAGGLLLALSYGLKFFPHLLEDERWMRTPARRLARAVLKYTHVAVFAAIVVAWLAYEIVERSR